MRCKLVPGEMTLAQLRSVYQDTDTQHRAVLDDGFRPKAKQSHATVLAACAQDAAVYGINTGFGKLASTRIAQDDLAVLQLKLLRSHAVGVGDPLSQRVVRLMLVLKAASLARGYSGVRLCVIDGLMDLYRCGICPVIPCQGSVGASGDLAPLAHLSLALIGEGEVLYRSKRMAAHLALQEAGLSALTLGAKEGLALINGTQASTALALDALFTCEAVFQAATLSGALTLDAARGSDAPFDPRVHAVRGHKGQIDCAAVYRELLKGSAIRASHLVGDERVQDPYCLRCQPQVMGACLMQMRYAAGVLLCEANAVTDNPLVFADDHSIISGGNFHAEPVAFAADALAIVIAEIGAIAERRVAMLVDASVSGLPAFLTPDPGLNSGFMIVHVTAAALASENKSLAHPASVDSLPTSANQEDHVSMATFAARRLAPMLKNTAYIVTIELLAAAQGIEFLRPLKSSEALEHVMAYIRSLSAAMMQDRSLASDIELICQSILDAQVISSLPKSQSLLQRLVLV
ncbi:MAG: histidine ammonia-lyase [Cytophagales bacterium]|nr:histidine ammonia-lyase [Cytophagales bacterium]